LFSLYVLAYPFLLFDLIDHRVIEVESNLFIIPILIMNEHTMGLSVTLGVSFSHMDVHCLND